MEARSREVGGWEGWRDILEQRFKAPWPLDKQGVPQNEGIVEFCGRDVERMRGT